MDVNMIYQTLVAFAGRIFLALIFLFVGLKVINILVNQAEQRMKKAEFEESLQQFLASLIRAGLLILLIISIASMLGAEVASFVAVIAAAGFAIGLALQGSLANFAGGVLILILKPFKVGDYIEGAGYAGSVKEIQIFHTVLNTPDNKIIIIPNANLSNNGIINYSTNPTRRVDFTFGVGYEDDINLVKDVLGRIAENDERVFADPAPQIVLGEHGDSAVVFYYRVWCKKEDYWTIYFDTLEKVKVEFDKEGISIPYPQSDVHLYNAQKENKVN